MRWLNVLVCAALLAGCSKSGVGASGALDPAKVPGAVNRAFAKAPEETKLAASNCVAALQNQDTSVAFLQLQQMNQQPDLTPQQHFVVAKAMQTTFKQLQTAADHGDTQAQTVMHQYLSTR
jgi:hypothetical protein